MRLSRVRQGFVAEIIRFSFSERYLCALLRQNPLRLRGEWFHSLSARPFTSRVMPFSSLSLVEVDEQAEPTLAQPQVGQRHRRASAVGYQKRRIRFRRFPRLLSQSPPGVPGTTLPSSAMKYGSWYTCSSQVAVGTRFG